MKISPGIDRDYTKEIKREKMENTRRKGMTACLQRGAGPLLFPTRIRCCSIAAKLQRLFIKALPGDSSPPPLHPHPPLLCFFTVCLTHFHSPIENSRERSKIKEKMGKEVTKGHKGRKSSHACNRMLCLLIPNRQCLFLEATFFCCC